MNWEKLTTTQFRILSDANNGRLHCKEWGSAALECIDLHISTRNRGQNVRQGAKASYTFLQSRAQILRNVITKRPPPQGQISTRKPALMSGSTIILF